MPDEELTAEVAEGCEAELRRQEFPSKETVQECNPAASAARLSHAAQHFGGGKVAKTMTKALFGEANRNGHVDSSDASRLFQEAVVKTCDTQHAVHTMNALQSLKEGDHGHADRPQHR